MPVPHHAEVDTGHVSPGSQTYPNLRPNSPFQYFISPGEIQLVAGEPLPLPAKCRIAPGVLGVDSKGDTAHFLTYQERRLRRVPIPLDFPVLSFGKEIAGYRMRTEVAPGDDGTRKFHFHDAWTRYATVGATSHREWDQLGWEDFCHRCLEYLAEKEQLSDGGLHPAVVNAERVRVGAVVARCDNTKLHAPARVNVAEIARLQLHGAPEIVEDLAPVEIVEDITAEDRAPTIPAKRRKRKAAAADTPEPAA